MIIPKSRLSYPHLWQADTVEGESDPSKARYGCSILLPKSDKATKAVLDGEIKRLVKERMKGVMPKSKDIAMKDGDGEYGDDYSKGCWIVSANRSKALRRPQVIDRKRQPLDEEDGKPNAGDVCNFLVSLYVPKKWPSKICFGLEIVQFVETGEPIGASAADADVMPEMDGDDEDDFDV